MGLLQERVNQLKKKYPDLTEDIDLNRAFEEFSEAKTAKILADIIGKSLQSWDEEAKVELLKSFWNDTELIKRVHATSQIIFQRALLMTIICLDENYDLPLDQSIESMKKRLDIKQKVIFHEVLESWDLEL